MTALIAALAVLVSALGSFALLRWLLGGFTPDMRLHRLAEGVYVYRGFFSNSGVLVLADCVVVIDTQTTPQAGERLRALIAEVTPLPIRYVLNTHYHGDHVGGNAAFPEAEVIAPAQTARFVEERDEERIEYCHTFGLSLQEVPAVRGPDRTFEGELVLRIGEDEVVLRQVGACETPDACIVWSARHRTVFAGDGVATDQYPWLGVPFLDEGLQDDGQWLGYLRAIRELGAEVLIPGHGAPLLGKETITARLDLLSRLLRDLLETARAELARGTPFEQLVERVDGQLAHYRRRPDLKERVVSQRFAIYRAWNSVNPKRRGLGWWQDLRPPLLQDSDRALVTAELQGRDGPKLRERARSLALRGRAQLGRDLLAAWLERHPEDAATWAAKAEVELMGAIRTKPIVDATEFISAASASSSRALELAPEDAVALLCRGVVDVWSALVTGQSMDEPIGRLDRALASGEPGLILRLLGRFFLAKAHQAAGRDEACTAAFRALLPLPLRPLTPLLIDRMRTLP